jgi:acyl-CoA thioesterase FadM
LRLSGQQVLVHVDINVMKPTPFPDDLRAGLERTRIDVSN